MTRVAESTSSYELRLPHVVPDPFGVEGVLPHDVLFEVHEDFSAYLLGSLYATAESDTGYAVVGLDSDHVQAVGGVDIPAVAYRRGPLPAVALHRYIGDLHYLDLP
jgi:hypothetical protein